MQIIYLIFYLDNLIIKNRHLSMKISINDIEVNKYDLVDNIGWIHPKNIMGYDVEELKKYNFNQINHICVEMDMKSDAIIYDYIEECFLAYPADFERFIIYGLWLIVETYSIFTANILPIAVRNYLPRDKVILNHIFDIIYNEYIKYKHNKIIAYIISEYLFNLFEFGYDFGVFNQENLNKISVFRENICIDDPDNIALCSFLSRENKMRIAHLLD